MNILIPIAGSAKRFFDAGYAFPKPLVEVLDKPMIQWVIENFSALDAQYIFVCNASDIRGYNLNTMLKVLAGRSKVVIQQQPAQGAVCSSLLAVDHLGEDEELIIAGGDQFLQVDLPRILEHFRSSGADGGIISFPSAHPQYSYARTANDNWVVEVAEKKTISPYATAGVYWYRRAGDYIDAAMQMIEKGDTFNDQYYICPAFNQMILAGKKILNYPIEKQQFVSFGTPDRVQQINAHGRF